MKQIRIFHNDFLTTPAVIQLSKEAAHHLINVLRVTINARVSVFNGKGGEHFGRVKSIAKRHVEIELEEFSAGEVESPITIHLAQAVARGEKMDFIIQKATELGVNMITPIFTEFSEVKLSAERWHKKLQHWQAIIISACEQCGRNRLPIIYQPLSFTDFLLNTKTDNKIILDPRGVDKLPALTSGQSTTILVGPEGGFSNNEIALVEKYQFTRVKLGPRILRTETAALAAVAALQFSVSS